LLLFLPRSHWIYGKILFSKRCMKVQVTTKCPNCGNNFTREMYEECVIVACGLEICPNCIHTDKYGNSVILVKNEIIWGKKL
jgi:hypothetical protein